MAAAGYERSMPSHLRLYKMRRQMAASAGGEHARAPSLPGAALCRWQAASLAVDEPPVLASWTWAQLATLAVPLGVAVVATVLASARRRQLA